MQNKGIYGSLIQSSWVNVGGFPTYLLRIGEISDQTKRLILIIPGNPGIADYYREFMNCLHLRSDCKTPVWCVSHAGHVNQTTSTNHSKDVEFNHKTLHGQIHHKLAFIRDHLPRNRPDIKLILIGHSIGCYMILSLLRSRVRIHRAALLFPTIEKMAESPSGRFVTPLLKYGARWALPILAYPVYYFLPNFVKRFIISKYFSGQSISPCAVTGTLQLTHPSILSSVLDLAHTEMTLVRDADHDTIAQHADSLLFYYGSKDKWAPKCYYDEMTRAHPHALMKMCERGIAHAFVLESSDVMADIVWAWIDLEERIEDVTQL